MEWLTGKNLTTLIIGAVVLLLDLWVCGLWGGLGTTLLNVQIVLCSIFLICLVLIQRGRGGGLAGAFGGMGGSSAFGTKAGDVLTWTTIITAIVWFLMAMRLVTLTNQSGPRIDFGDSGSSREVPITGGSGASTTSDTTPEAAPGTGVIPKAATTPITPGGEASPPTGNALPPALEDPPAEKGAQADPAPTATPAPLPSPPPSEPTKPSP